MKTDSRKRSADAGHTGGERTGPGEGATGQMNVDRARLMALHAGRLTRVTLSSAPAMTWYTRWGQCRISSS